MALGSCGNITCNGKLVKRCNLNELTHIIILAHLVMSNVILIYFLQQMVHLEVFDYGFLQELGRDTAELEVVRLVEEMSALVQQIREAMGLAEEGSQREEPSLDGLQEPFEAWLDLRERLRNEMLSLTERMTLEDGSAEFSLWIQAQEMDFYIHMIMQLPIMNEPRPDQNVRNRN